MEQGIELHICHRNRLFSDCLASALAATAPFQVTQHDQADWEEWVEPLSGPLVALVDMHISDGSAADLIHRLASIAECKVLVLISRDDPDAIVRCVAAGASGCVLEEASLSELRVAIERVSTGETFCSPQLVRSMFAQLSEYSRGAVMTDRAEEVNLTPREREVLEHLGNRLTNQEIANKLSLSLYTVKNHVHNILEKLQVTDRFDAIEHARDRRLLSRARSSSPSLATRR